MGRSNAIGGKFSDIQRIREIMNRKLNGAGVTHTDQHSTPHLRMLMTEVQHAPVASISWTQASHERAAALRRRDRIAVAAFYLSEARGFAPGHEAEDWLLAQTQVDVIDTE
jgi:Protein of unknown function (DUF2934)